MNIYQYEKVSAYLHDAWREKKRKNPSFSLRSWAKKLGLSSNAPLTLMFQEKRPIPKRYLHILAQDLGLSKEERNYLENLLEYNRAKDQESKNYYYNILQELSPKGEVKFIQIEHARLIQNPLHFILLDSLTLPGAKADAHWIKEHLKFDASIAEINECLNRLLEMRFIQIEDGKIKRFEGHYNTSVDVPDKSIETFHARSSDFAKEILGKTPVERREFNVTYANISSKRIDEAKKKIRKFISEFLEEFDTNQADADCTYQLNTQFFELLNTQGVKCEKINH